MLYFDMSYYFISYHSIFCFIFVWNNNNYKSQLYSQYIIMFMALLVIEINVSIVYYGLCNTLVCKNKKNKARMTKTCLLVKRIH